MSTVKKPKWDIGIAINKGTQSVALVEKYKEEIEARLQPDELEQHISNIAELGNRRAAQKENMVQQKSSTLGQDEAIIKLRDVVMDIRRIVKSCTPTGEILKAFGVGERVYKTVSSTMAAANIVISACNNHAVWSKSAGILEADITLLSQLIASMTEADQSQETSKFERKSKTMNKNALHRSVEDEVSKISAIGVFVFRFKNPAIADIFAGLIPVAVKKKE